MGDYFNSLLEQMEYDSLKYEEDLFEWQDSIFTKEFLKNFNQSGNELPYHVYLQILHRLYTEINPKINNIIDDVIKKDRS